MRAPQLHRHRTSARRSAARGGFTLLELLIAFSVLTIAIGGALSAMFSSNLLQEGNRERSLASGGAMSMLEQIRAEEFSDVFALYNDNPLDDPDGVGTAPGSGFVVDGLDPRGDDADGMVGEVVFPGDGTLLFEDGTDRILAMPRDLNGDGAVDAFDHSTDYRVLPVVVRVRWTGQGGGQSVEFMTCLVEL